MTEAIQQLKEDIAVLQEKLNKLEEIEKQPKMTLENEGKFEIVSYNDKCYVRMDYSYDTLWYMSKNTKDFDGNNLILITDDETRNILEGLRFNQVKKDEPTKPMDEVVERLLKKYQEQKLYNRLFEFNYEKEDCDWILGIVEDWIPDEQSSAGSQDVNTELLVKGFNDAIRKMKLKELIHDYYINSNAAQSSDVIANEIVNVVKEWLKNYHKEDNNKYDFDYFSGWADCIDILEGDLR